MGERVTRAARGGVGGEPAERVVGVGAGARGGLVTVGVERRRQYPGPPVYPRNYENYQKEFESYDGIPMQWSRNPHASYEEDYAYELAYERYIEEQDLEFFRFQARDQAIGSEPEIDDPEIG